MQSLILGKTVAIRKKIMIEKNLIFDSVKNVILMNSFCSTGDLKKKNKNQKNQTKNPTRELLLKQALVESSHNLQKLEFQTHFQRKATRFSANAGYCGSLEIEGVHLSFPTLCKIDAWKISENRVRR